MGSILRFVKNSSPYVIGDVAGFADKAEADRLLSNGVAVLHSEPKRVADREIKAPEFDRQMKPAHMTFNRRRTRGTRKNKK